RPGGKARRPWLGLYPVMSVHSASEIGALTVPLRKTKRKEHDHKEGHGEERRGEEGRDEFGHAAKRHSPVRPPGPRIPHRTPDHGAARPAGTAVGAPGGLGAPRAAAHVPGAPDL